MKTYDLSIVINEDGQELYKKLKLDAENSTELSQKLNALKILNRSVSHEDFISTVEMIHEKPGLVPVVKEMLEEGEELTEAQLMVRLPRYVKKVLAVLKS